MKGDIRIKMERESLRIGNRYLWSIYKRGWFFYPMFPELVYAKTRSEALAEYERINKEREAALNA